MNIDDGLLMLASETRQKCFREARDEISVIISSSNGNKGYLSGYFSMNHDLNPLYLSAVIATREKAVLIVSAADAGPALEALGDPALIYRYGFFCFESDPDKGPGGYDVPGAETFDEAVVAAVDAIIGDSDVIGVDRSNGDALWNLIRQSRSTNWIVDVTDAIVRSRRTKLDGEILRITAATKLVETGLREVFSQARTGMTERDLAAVISHQMVRGGGVPRFVSVTSGPRSALADSYPKSRSIEAGDLVRIDAGCVVGGYTSDMARTMVFGEPDKLQSARYHAIKTGIEEELLAVRAGVTAKNLFEGTVKAVRQNGIPSYRRQHVGHGIGIAGSYDFPIIAPGSDATLETGMCLCLETPYYVIGWGGMMIEDTVTVTQNGFDPITTIERDLVCIG